MSQDHAPDPLLRIAELLERSSLDELALHRLYARLPRRTTAPQTIPAPLVSAGFAVRLNKLFDSMPAPGARPHTNSAIAAQLTAWGHPISKPYISQLREGTRLDPSRETIAALARYFRVRPGYLTAGDHLSPLGPDHDLLIRLQSDRLRDLCLRAYDLSEESQNLLTAMADRLRLSERLPEVGTGGVE